MRPSRRIAPMSRPLICLLGSIMTLAGLFATTTEAVCCPFCPAQGRTLSAEVDQANLIVFGTLMNAQRDPKEFGKGTTEMQIDLIVKDHEFLKGKKIITLPRYVPPDPKNPRKFLVFCEIFKGELDPYRGEQVNADSKIAEYLKGAIAVRDKDAAAKLKYFFQYLDSSEPDISADAYAEFAIADYKDVHSVAVKLPPATFVKWLQDPNTPPSRFGLYGYMLGLCGNAKEHAPVLRAMLEDPKRKYSSGLDGMLYGYVLLDPKAGWKYLLGMLSDESSEFLTRYAVLRTLRVIWENPNGTIKPEAIMDAMQMLVAQGDIADLPIEDLRRWQRWEMTDKVLELYGQKSHNIPIVKRAIIRYALCVPNNPKAAEFIKQRRAEDPEKVKDIENLLELEKPIAPEPKKTEAKK
jgi:hypothetical protein